MGTLWRSCAKMHEPIELPFGVVSGVGADTDVLDGGAHSQGEREVLGTFLEGILVYWF